MTAVTLMKTISEQGESISGLLRVLEILEDARGNAVLVTDPYQSD
ncbi:hypothetical protein [Nocardia sp. NPDC059239]